MPLDPRWVAAPPEIVALIFEGGPGPESIVAYAAVMATEAASHQMGMAVSATNIATTSASWTGLAGTANVARGTALNTGGLEPLAAHCAKHVMLAQAAVDAYTMASPSVIPSVACQANRDLWGTLNATNFFGQNTPGIVSQDIQYFGDYWPQNSSVGLLYATTLGSIAAAAAVPPPAVAGDVAPAGLGSAATLAGQVGSTAGQDAAQASTTAGGQLASAGSAPSGAADQMTSMLGQGPQLLSGAMQPLTQMTQAPMQMAQTGLGPLQSMMGMFTGANAPAEAAGLGGDRCTTWRRRGSRGRRYGRRRHGCRWAEFQRRKPDQLHLAGKHVRAGERGPTDRTGGCAERGGPEESDGSRRRWFGNADVSGRDAGTWRKPIR